MEPNLKLRLSNDTAEVDQESRQELNLLDSLDNRPWNAQESNNQDLRQKVQKREFCCKYCDKKFSNSQALGGHQNAHRRERALSRKEKEMMGLYHPYSHIGSHLHMTIAPHLGMPYNYLPRFMHEDGWSNKPNPMNSQIAMPQSDDYSLWSCNGEFPQLGTAVPSVLKLLP